MKVFLLNPPGQRIAEKHDLPVYQHIGLGYLAGAVEAAGHELIVLDAKLERKNRSQVLRTIAAAAPDILGVTAMTHQIDDAADIARECKIRRPATITVIGGVHTTALPVETLKQYPQFDFGIAGEGEVAFVRLINMIASGHTGFGDMPGLACRHDTAVAYTPFERISDLDSLALPAWHHFPGIRTYSTMTSRGCPHRCAFCMQALGHVVRERDIDQVVAEIKTVLAEVHPERIAFHDETFTSNRKRIHRLCREFIRAGIHKQVKWNVTTRADAVDSDLLRIMKEAGCDSIEFGVESGSEKILKNTGKNITRQQAQAAVSMAKDLGYHVECGFIFGHPHETLATALETVDFAARLNPDLVQLGIMVPYPGTAIRELAMAGQGGYVLLSQDWRSYNKQLGNALELRTLSRADLERLQLIGYLRLFAYNRRYIDFLKFIWQFKREMIAYIQNTLANRFATIGQGRKGTRITIRQAVRYIISRDILASPQEGLTPP